MFLLEKRKKRKLKRKKNKNTIKGIYGVPLYWYSYPVGGFAELDSGSSE